MSVSVNAESAKIKPKHDGARPTVHIGHERVTCHLYRGFDAGSPDGVLAHALDADGSVNISMGPSDKLSGWQFGFVQIARANDVSFYYAGKHRSHGSIIIHAHQSPALADSLILDTELEMQPWTRQSPRYTYTPPSIKCKTGDHPAVRAGRELMNKKTNVTNYLYHIVTKLEFWTVFSYHNQLMKWTHMRHFHWTVLYNVMFSWTAGTPRPTRPQSRLNVGEDVEGPPGDSAVSQMLARPVVQFSFNASLRSAIARSIMSGAEPNRTDLTSRFTTVPSDFWSD